MTRLRFIPVFLLLVACRPVTPPALWPGSKFAETDRASAIGRALAFLYRAASTPKFFAEFGHDFLLAFQTIASTSRDPGLRDAAREMGQERAKQWRLDHPHVPARASGDDVVNLVVGAYAADALGQPDNAFKLELRTAAKRFTAVDLLSFDAVTEPPHGNKLRSRYDIWTDALINSYFGDVYGIPLGAPYSDVVRWISVMRPYPAQSLDEKFDRFYAITHVVYTLNGYQSKRVSPVLLAPELEILRGSLKEAITSHDPEVIGECLDTLKAFGLDNDAEVHAGIEYLLSSQRLDGSWTGDKDDPYTAYHSAWTGIDGLRDYQWQGEVTQLPAHK